MDDGARGVAERAQVLKIFDSAPVVVAATTGADHRLLYINDAYRATFGDRPLDRPSSEVADDLLWQDYLGLLDKVLEEGEPVVQREAPLWLPDPSGEQRLHFFSFSLSKIDWTDLGLLFVAVDVTEQVMTARRAGRAVDEQRRILRRFESLVRVSAEIVWVTDPAGGVAEPSPGWQRVTGQTWEEFRGDGWLQALHPDDRESAMRGWREAVREARPYRHVYRLRTVDEGYRHFAVHSTPIFEGGAVLEWVGSCTDVEDEWRSERHQELLDRAAAATAEHTGVREMLGALANVLVPRVADGCGVHLLSEIPDLPRDVPVTAHRIATAAREGLPLLQPAGEERFPADTGFVRTVRQRRPLHLVFEPGRPPPELLPAGTEGWIAEVGANSLVLLPVTVDGAVAAVVTAAVCGNRPPLSADDVALLGRIFEHAHDALSSAMEYHRTQRVARALQHSLLAEPPRVPGLEIVARYLPSPDAAEVGGDWYDSFVLPDGGTTLVIGDVVGHNLAAAVTMSQLRNMLRGLVLDRREAPGEILRRLSSAMEVLIPESTATCVLARLDGPEAGEWRLDYAVAGHPPPLLVEADGRCRLLEGAGNPLLGLLVDDDPFTSAIERLRPGSTVLLYTDGLIERPGEDLDEGLARLRRQAEMRARTPLPGFCDGILADLPVTGIDDVAVIALRIPETP